MAKGNNPGNQRKQAAARPTLMKALELRAEGLTLSQIANQLGLSCPQAASKLVQKALKATIEEPAEHLRKVSLERLDLMYREAMDVLRGYHLVISNGVAVRDPTFQFDPDEHVDGSVPREALIRDTGPVLAAIDRLLKIEERRAKLLGLDAPKKTELTGADGGPVEFSEIRRTIIDPKHGGS